MQIIIIRKFKEALEKGSNVEESEMSVPDIFSFLKEHEDYVFRWDENLGYILDLV